MKKAIFIDRDGVINRLVKINGKETSPKRLDQLDIYNFVPYAIKQLRNNYLIIIVTNQPDIARGRISIKELNKINKKIKDEIDIDDFFICVHDDDDDCQCRKPKPGLILDAAKKWEINLSGSFIIGDSWRDMIAGKSAGLKTCWVNNNSDSSFSDPIKFAYNFEAKNLLDAINYIL